VSGSHPLRRLLRIREMEEEQSRLALENALTERSRLQAELLAAEGRGRRGRALIATSARSGELSDRLAGMEEARIAQRLHKILSGRISDSDSQVNEKRQSYFSSRMARLQADKLTEAFKKNADRQTMRRNQRELDEWFRSRA
jgi:flagellar biosynthesis chaperone FliJ